jgi:tRNA (cytidine/uridine-2'-O-)-methyltransferase
VVSSDPRGGDTAPRFAIVLVAPQIGTNTGNIIRLSANVGAQLYLVEPLGFSLDDAALRRAGLDYHDLADVTVVPSWAAARTMLGDGRRWFALSSRGATGVYDAEYRGGDVFVFGPEREGLSDETLADFECQRTLRIPMRPANRSLNLANAVAVVVYEAWRQTGFVGAGEVQPNSP